MKLFVEQKFRGRLLIRRLVEEDSKKMWKNFKFFYLPTQIIKNEIKNHFSFFHPKSLQLWN